MISDSRLTAEVVAAALANRGIPAEGRLLDDTDALTGRTIVVLANRAAEGLERLRPVLEASDGAASVHVFVRTPNGESPPAPGLDVPVRATDLALGEVLRVLDAGPSNTIVPLSPRPHRIRFLNGEAGLVRNLSPREREVLREFVGGGNYRDVAERLALAVGTVRTHVQSIRAKLGVSSVVEAVAVARRAGLRPPIGDHRGFLDEVAT